jgi:hypothetical protein
MSACIVCGEANGTCGHQPLAFPPITALTEVNPVADTKIYVPKQKSRRGVAGYRGANVVVVDPDTGKEDKQATAKAQRKGHS